jgi:hypothetical protein
MPKEIGTSRGNLCCHPFHHLRKGSDLIHVIILHLSPFGLTTMSYNFFSAGERVLPLGGAPGSLYSFESCISFGTKDLYSNLSLRWCLEVSWTFSDTTRNWSKWQSVWISEWQRNRILCCQCIAKQNACCYIPAAWMLKSALIKYGMQGSSINW